MPKPTLKALTTLLNRFRKDGQVNISWSDGITYIRVMSDDGVSIFECACHTGGEDHEEIALAKIDIKEDEITGDKQEKKLLIARLPELVDHQINFNVDGNNFASCIRKHSNIINGLHNDGRPYSKTVLSLDKNILHMFTRSDDIGVKEEHRSELNVTSTQDTEEYKFDAIKLYNSVFKHMIPEEINVRIMIHYAPLEVWFNFGGWQCHYIQAQMIDN